MAKKMDKAVKDLAKELKKLRKEYEKLVKAVEKTRKDQAESSQKVLDLLEERSTAQGAGSDEEDHPHDENGGFVTAETAAEGDGDVPEASAEAQQEEPEVTDAANRRAKELGVDLSDVKGTGSGGRVLVKDVEAVAGQ